MSKQWFILNVLVGAENKVKDQLTEFRKSDQEHFGAIEIPEVKEEIVKKKKTIVSSRKAFPGYVFAEFDLFKDFINHEKNSDVWEKVTKMDGMICLLGGDNPRPMSEEEILSVKKYSNKKSEKKTVFNVNDSVKILDGAFANNVGTVKKLENDIATVEFEIFGEMTEHEISTKSLEKIS